MIRAELPSSYELATSVLPSPLKPTEYPNMVFVTGVSARTPETSDIATVAYSAAGSRLWVRRWISYDRWGTVISLQDERRWSITPSWQRK